MRAPVGRDVAHPGQVDEQAAVAHRATCRIITAAAH
jgi:hypothetical protein